MTALPYSEQFTDRLLVDSSDAQHLAFLTEEMLLDEALGMIGAHSQMDFATQHSELLEAYWLNIAPADELAAYIVRQPNYTWNGLTIRPDEVWRYQHNDLWIHWRQNWKASAERLGKVGSMKRVLKLIDEFWWGDE